MKLLVLLLIFLYASSTWSQDFDFICGFSQMSESDINQAVDTTPINHRRGQIKTLILFSKFNGAEDPFDLRVLEDREGKLSKNADSLLSVTHEGSLAHYFHKMSDGILTLVPGSGGVNLIRYEAAGDSLNDYVGKKCANIHSGLKTFVTEVLINANRDNSIYSSDVDIIAVIVPIEFGFCTGGTIFSDKFGNGIQVNKVALPDVITATEVQSFPLIVGVLAHEYGHAMRLPELYDVTVDSFARENEGAGIGLWGVMGRGPVGWRRGKIGERYFGSGPTAMSAWSRIRVGWITPKTVSADTLGVQIHDINSENGKVFKIAVPNSDKEYFLVENRQNTYSETKNTTMVGSYYDDYAPESGLAIWHVDDTVGFSSTANTDIDDETLTSLVNANINEFHKRVDLECADGLFSDRGYPGNTPYAVDGGDNLDYFSRDTTYGKSKNGNLGDTTDVWNGLTGKLSTDTLFTPYTNPSTAGYNGNDQNVFTGIAVRNISQTNGVMSFDVRFIPSAPRDLGVAAPRGQTQVTLAWSEPMVNATAISEYQYSIDETNWTCVDGGASTRFVLFDNSTSTTFWVRAVTAHEHGEAAKIDLDRPGTVTLASNNTLAKPTVGDTLTAALTDVNGSISGKKWQWERGTVSGGSWTGVSIAKATDARYNLTVADVGQQVRATVSYMDGAGDNTDTAASLPTSSVVGVPSAPDSLTATPGDKQVVLSWAAADSNGAWIKSYSVQDSTVGGTWSAWVVVSGGGPARTTTRTGLTNGTRYWFAVRATNSAGAGRADTVSALPAVPKPPTITGRLQPSLAENSTDSVATYQAKTGGGKALSWTLGGTDVSAFRTSGDTLYFKQAPNYEAPLDAGKNNQYDLTIRAVDGKADTTVSVTVSVSNVEEKGTLALSPLPPRAHRAITATLTDPDSVVTIQRWRWLPYVPGFGGIGATAEATAATEAATEATAAAATVSSGHTSTYTPNIFFHKANLQIEVTAFYTDGHGAGKQVQLVTARVGPPDRAGTIALTTTDPEVGTAVTATLTDDDGSITGASWQWKRRPSSSGTWQDVSSASASASAATYPEVSSYTPQAGDVGYQLRATVSYRDGYAPNRRVEGTATNAVVDVPDAPGSPTATAGDRQVVLTWTTPANNGSAITSYAYRDSTVGANKKWSAWQDITGSGATTTTPTVTGLTNDTAYWFQVRAKNGVGAGAASDTVSATPGSPKPPTITGRLQPSFAENSTDSVATYQAKTGGGKALSWTLGGTDVSAFRTSGDTLYFKQAPNYEAPTDGGKNNQYDLTIRAVDGKADTTVSVRVSVSNIDEAGTVELSSKQPKVGQHLTASLTSEPDGLVTGTDTWNWTRLSSRSAEAEASSSLSESYRYTVLAEDLGKWLVARVRYTDGHDKGKSASDTTTAAVVADVPGAPGSLTATAGDKQVVLTWTTAANNGSALTGYAYRDSTVGSNKKWSDWQDITGSGATTTTHTVTGLTNDTAYWFQVHAENTPGDGQPSAVVSATPKAAKPPTITGRLQPSFAENSTDSVATYQAKTTGGTAISWTLGGTDVSAFRTSGDTLYFKQAPNYEAPADGGKNNQYDLTIRAVDGKADTTVAVTVTVSNEDETGTISLSPTTPQAGASITATLSDPDGSISGVSWSWAYFSASGTAEATETDESEGTAASLTKTITVSRTKVGYSLKFYASYTDGQGTGKSKSAQSAKTAPITAPPNTPGSVSLSTTTPQAKQSITATLTDPDTPITVTKWTWFSANASATDGEAEMVEEHDAGTANGSLSNTRTISHTLVGKKLKARVSYTDSFGSQTAESAYTSPVTAAPDQLGSVSLSTSQPTVGQSLTATLSDADGGIKNLRWSWSYFSGSGADETETTIEATDEVTASGLSTTYTPSRVLVGYRLRARALYDDAHGTGKQAQSAKTSAVQATTPSAPRSLTATAGDKQVALSWSAPSSDGGASISRYEYRYKGSGSWSSWSSVGTSTSTTVSSLTNNTSYPSPAGCG